jgi:hypothetical protein
MSTMGARTTGGAAPAPSLRVVALPTEHGGWGLLGEPLVLGLLLAPSWGGAGIAIAAVGAFLSRHPLKLVLADLRRGARYPRTAVAARVAAAYAGGMLAGLALAAAVASPRPWWAPLVAAAPLGLAQLSFDARHRGRQLAPELLGGVALGSVAAAILLAGGRTWTLALLAWGFMAAKAVTSVLFVRARLRLDRGLATGRRAALVAHVAALGAALGAAAAGPAPWLAAVAFLMLWARAARGLAATRRALAPREVGFRELGFGVATTALLALGFGFEW